MEEAQEKGLALGIEQGIKQGISKGLLTKVREMAKSLLIQGVDPLIISRASELSVDEIKSL